MSKINRSERKERIGWYLYDWANSAFSTTVVTVFMGPYLSSLAAKAADASGFVYPLGIQVFSESVYPYAISISVLFQLLFLPFIGAMADLHGMKRQLLVFFAYFGSAATVSMLGLTGDMYLLGAFLFILANLCFGASMVVYNSFLSDIAEREHRDQVSSIGWGIGYLGGGLLLLINLLIFSNAKNLFAENPESTAVRVCLASAGIWWALFSFFPAFLLKNRKVIEIKFTSPAASSWSKLKNTIKELKHEKNALLFLLAFIFYNDGVQAVITLSAQFAQRELGLSSSLLVQAILMVQFVAFGGAFLFKYIAKPLGAKSTIIALIVVWSLVTYYAYSYLNNAQEFFILAAVIGAGMGGIQALSRSMYSRIIPEGKEAEYFSIYELSEKGSSLLGPLAFALAMQFTKSYRVGILSLIIFFVLGFFLLIKVKDKE
jgi:UMF1 family MFS transporter